MTTGIIKTKKLLLFLCILVVFLFTRKKKDTWTISDKISSGEIQTTTAQAVTGSNKKEPSAFKKLRFEKMALMKKLEISRPLFNFVNTPWKNEHVQNGNNITIEQKWSMIVGVKSHVQNFKKRETIRKTWGSYRKFLGVRLEIIFVIATAGDSETELRILEENKNYGDLLQINQTEVYKNVGFKTLAAMQWIGDHFPLNWIYSSSDDDMLPNLPLLYGEIESLVTKYSTGMVYEPDVHVLDMSNIPIHCAFSLRDKRVPIRNPKIKNNVPIDLYSEDKYPTFCAGGFYSMPVKLCKQLYTVSRQHEYFIMDDVWITGLLRLVVVDSYGYYGCDKVDQYCAISQKGGSSVQHLKRLNSNEFLKKWMAIEPNKG